MKSVAELNQMRSECKNLVELRDIYKQYKIVVGMGTCGLEAGAKEVMKTLVDEIYNQNLDNVIVLQSGCQGMCSLEPTMEVIDETGKKTVYVKMDKEKALEVLNTHIKCGQSVDPYTLVNAHRGE